MIIKIENLKICFFILAASISNTYAASTNQSITVPVNIHGVNYTADTFSYVVRNPADKSDKGTGELIDPFAAGGTVCCYQLPKQWKAGIQINIDITKWLQKKENNKLQEVKEQYLVEVPRYGDGTPGELWVMRNPDGSIGVISSNYQPNHILWPGSIKGWPVPSREYQRQRWNIYIKHEEEGVILYESLLDEIRTSPSSHTLEAWNYALKYDRKSLSAYTGPSDPNYYEMLKEGYEASLKRTQLKLEKLRQSRP